MRSNWRGWCGMVERFDDLDEDDDQGRHQGREKCSDQGPGWEGGAQLAEGEDLSYRGQADHDQHAVTFDAMRRIGVSVGELWLYYLSMGGDVDEYEVDAYLHGLVRLPALDRDLISQSVNEMIDDICRGPRAPYSASRHGDTPRVDPGPEQDADVGAIVDGPFDAFTREFPEDKGNDSGSPEEDGVFSRGTVDAGTALKVPLLSVVYSSAATRSFTDADLAELLTTSRSTNHATHLTGLLLYRRGRFLQVLEGPEATVRDRMAIITADPRHTRLRVLVEETRNERHFPDWTMGYEPISPEMSYDVPGYEKTFTDEDDDADPAGTVQVLRDLIRWFQDRAIPLR
jgi:hypothetical protein